MILFLGITTSYEDIKFGKIRNKWIILAIIYGISINSILFALDYHSLGYLIRFFLNSLLSLLVGFIVWYSSLWTAGDAKLFFSYSLLLPLDIYSLNYSKLFPSMSILVYAFTPMALFLITFALIKTNNRKKFKYFVKAFNLKQIVNFALFLFTITWFFNLFFNFLGIENNYIFTIFLMFLIFLIIEKIFNIRIIIFLLFLSFIRIIFDKKIFLLQTWKSLLFALAIFIVLRLFLLILAFNAFSKNVKIKRLKVGMIPAEAIYAKGKLYRKRKIRNFGLMGIFHSITRTNKYLFNLNAEGLSRKDIENLRKIEAKLSYNTIKIQQTISFAPFLFLGVIIALMLGYVHY